MNTVGELLLRLVSALTVSVLISCATAPTVRTAQVLEPGQRSLGFGFSQMKFGDDLIDAEVSSTLPDDVPDRIALNLISASVQFSVTDGIDLSGGVAGMVPTDESLSGKTGMPSFADAKFRIVDFEWFQSALAAGVGFA